MPVCDSDAWCFGGLLALFQLAGLRRGVVSATCCFVEYVRVGSLLVTLELAAAGLSGLFAFRGMGGIDGGNDCFGNAVFGGGDFGGPIESGGLGAYGGNGGCDTSVLRLVEAGVVASVSSVVMVSPGTSSCFLFDPGCVGSKWARLVPLCTITTSASPTSVSLSNLVLDIFRGFVGTLSGSNSGAFPRVRL